MYIYLSDSPRFLILKPSCLLIIGSWSAARWFINKRLVPIQPGMIFPFLSALKYCDIKEVYLGKPRQNNIYHPETIEPSSGINSTLQGSIYSSRKDKCKSTAGSIMQLLGVLVKEKSCNEGDRLISLKQRTKWVPLRNSNDTYLKEGWALNKESQFHFSRSLFLLVCRV